MLLLASQLGFLHAQGTSLQTAPDIPWSMPTAAAINNLGPVNNQPRNYECTSLTYRVIDDLSKTMHDGCFVSAAFGMLDPDQGMVIFNGTDEAESIRMGSGPAALSVLPFSATVARFGGFPAQGSYMYLYNYFTRALTETRDWQLHRYKELSSSYDTMLTDSSGRPLDVNNGAMAYSARGEWMVVESPSHALLRINLATFEILPFAPTFAVTGKPYAYHTASMAITQDGRYVAVASDEFLTLKVYDLRRCTASSNTAILYPESCEVHDYWPFVGSQIAGNLTSISHLKFVNDGLLSFDATNGNGTDSYELSPNGPITSLISYLGLGDSYASGQGAYNYLPATDTSVNHCHLSSHSYPLRLNADSFAGGGHSVACSGATISDIGSLSPNYTGQSTDQKGVHQREVEGSDVSILHDFTPGYLSQQSFVNAYQPATITVQIGGNDIGFKDILLHCVGPKSCYTSYEDRLEVEQTIDRVHRKWVTLFEQLQKTAPTSRIYIIGYPQIVSTSGKCGLNVHLDTANITFARDTITYLNSAISRAANTAGVPYVDISNALPGHQLCDGTAQPAMNGLTAGNDIYGVLGQESYHPTAFGHELIEQAILQATHHFAYQPKPAAETSNGAALLQAPKSGRATTNVIPLRGITADKLVRGKVATITVSGSEVGLRANTPYTIQLGDNNIGSVQSDQSGNISTPISVPSNSPPGSQPITVSGPGQNGDTVSATQPTYVASSADDTDGDGIPNAQDTCPAVVNSGVDADRDNLDDACDTTIGSSASSETTLIFATPPNPTTSIVQSSGRVGLQATLSAVELQRGGAQFHIGASTAIHSSTAQGLLLGKPTEPFTQSAFRAPIAQFSWYVWLVVIVGVALLLQGSLKLQGNLKYAAKNKGN